MNNTTIAERIKTLRKKAGLTQAQLAEKLNVSISVLGGAETKRGCSKDLAMKLSTYFSKPLDYFVNENAENEFIQEYNPFETTYTIVKKLIKENMITENGMNEDVEKLITDSLKFDIKIMLKKEKL